MCESKRRFAFALSAVSAASRAVEWNFSFAAAASEEAKHESCTSKSAFSEFFSIEGHGAESPVKTIFLPGVSFATLSKRTVFPSTTTFFFSSSSEKSFPLTPTALALRSSKFHLGGSCTTNPTAGQLCLTGNARMENSGFLKKTPEETSLRSEERRVGKECRSRWPPY